MKEYKINRQSRTGEDYQTMVVFNRATGEEVAEYRLTLGSERIEIASMRRSIDRHLASGGTLGNYGW